MIHVVWFLQLGDVDKYRSCKSKTQCFLFKQSTSSFRRDRSFVNSKIYKETAGKLV